MLSRRNFLANSAVSFAGATSVLGALSTQTANAANTAGYRAIVCIMLQGGMDHADTILPTDQASYDQLAEQRQGLFSAYGVGSSGGRSSRERGNILTLNPTNAADFGSRRFGLPRELREVRQMFNSGDLAIIGNVGPLIEPTDRASIASGSARLPRALFSHNDQRSTWLSFGPEGTALGWGGRFADATIASDPASNPVFAAVTAGANDVFLSGEEARPFRAASSANGAMLSLSRGGVLQTNDNSRRRTVEAISALVTDTELSDDSVYERDIARINRRGLENAQSYVNALSNSPSNSTTFPDTSIGQQLEAVTATISARNALNVGRQVFYVTMRGWDSHSGQATDLPLNHTQLSEALAAFRTAMIAEGIWDDVVAFTASDFGRTLNDNGDGTDHGWGGHHFVMGGSVVGQRIYGDIPPPNPNSRFYTDRRARLIPSISVESYAETLGLWYGLNPAELRAALPNLDAFPGSTLDFLG